MVIKYDNVWVAIPLLLIPIGWVIIMMALIRTWMFSAPKTKRQVPEYSMHVMYEQPSKQAQRALYGQGYGTKKMDPKETQPYGYATYTNKAAPDPYSMPYGPGSTQAYERAGTPTFQNATYASVASTGASSAQYSEKSRII